MTETSTSFTYPEFWFYPPYFTIQPIKETQQKQKELWRDLILRYCRQHRIYTIENDESDDFPPFNNPAINRRLNREARSTLLLDLIQRGDATWADPKTQRTVIIFWKSPSDWGDTIYSWAIDTGLKDSVVTLEELQNGDEVKGTELDGIHKDVLIKALKALEGKGKAKLFKGSNDDDEGVKFF